MRQRFTRLWRAHKSAPGGFEMASNKRANAQDRIKKIRGRQIAIRIIRPGGDKYGLYQGCFCLCAFLTSAKNQLPIMIAAINTPAYFTSVNQLNPSILHFSLKIRQLIPPALYRHWAIG